MSPEKLIPPLLQILEEALQNPDPVRRRAAFLAMAVIAEGCSEAITHKYLEPMLNIIKGGISDQEPLVRNAAFFALGQFSEHLQPEISKYAPQILPVLYDYLGQLVNELKVSLIFLPILQLSAIRNLYLWSTFFYLCCSLERLPMTATGVISPWYPPETL